jgi:uncharacterized protein with PIN domain
MPEKMTFLCDRMLGNLCRKLRLLGFDAALNPDGESGRFLTNAEREGRIAVTRSRHHHDRPGKPPVILDSENLLDQIVELFSRLPESPRFEPFTRCLECNEPLVEESSSSIEAEVPPYITEHFQRYHRCPACRRIYWEGSHFQAMSVEIEDIRSRIEGRGGS